MFSLKKPGVGNSPASFASAERCSRSLQAIRDALPLQNSHRDLYFLLRAPKDIGVRHADIAESSECAHPEKLAARPPNPDA